MPFNDENIHTQDAFIRHLEEASQTVRSWPKWKQGIWGPALPEEREEKQLKS